MKKKIFLAILILAIMSMSKLTMAADITGTNGNDFMFFQGNTEQVTTTITNSYSGQSIFIDDWYNLNTAVYDGLGGIDTLFMSIMGDFLSLRNDANEQTVYDIEYFVTGNGGDVINLSDDTIVLGDMVIHSGWGNDIVWANAGDDIIYGQEGDDQLDGGLGNDLIYGGNGNDTFSFGYYSGIDEIYGEYDFDTIAFSSGITLDDLTITELGGSSFDILVGDLGDQIFATDVEQLLFSDNSTLSLTNYIPYTEPVPEPSTIALLGIGVVGLLGGAARKKYKRRKQQ